MELLMHAVLPFKLRGLSLKDNPCQGSAHLQKHDPVKPHNSWGRIAKSWRSRCCAPSHTSGLACVMKGN